MRSPPSPDVLRVGHADEKEEEGRSGDGKGQRREETQTDQQGLAENAEERPDSGTNARNGSNGGTGTRNEKRKKVKAKIYYSTQMAALPKFNPPGSNFT